MRKRKWPLVKNRAGFTSRGDIKEISYHHIELLATKARDHHWSGQGRPSWLRQHRDNIVNSYITFLHQEADDCFRCSVAIILADGSGWHFAIDVSVEDFERLNDADEDALVRMAHLYLNSFKHVSLDPDQQATWNRTR